MKRLPRYTLAATLIFALAGCTDAFSRQAPQSSYVPKLTADLHVEMQARRDSVIDFYANRIRADSLHQGGYIDIAAKLARGKDLPWVEARLDSLMASPRGDMFWMYPFITVTYAGRQHLSATTKQKMRSLWRTYTPYRGDTENHWAMYYAAMYLITQMYPDEPGPAWFNGKSSSENFEEAQEYLLDWMRLTTTIGQGEYDSPDYINVYIVPMAQLYAWAADPDMRQRAGMMLDYIIADFAAENLHGLYVGAHSRVYPRQALEQWWSSSTGMSWLLFGNTKFRPRGESTIVALSGYTVPPIIHYIATDRTQTYIHRERKRTRHRMRYSDVKNAPVYKYTYMRPEYALGSSQGGLLQPIQQHTWDLTWTVPDAQGVHNTFFALHPYSSPIELGMYFAEHLGPITELVVRSKTTYDSPEKWTGGSPYQRVFQHEDALIVLFDIPAGIKFQHISAFFSKDLALREEDPSGWIFARGGDAFIACRPFAPYEWRPEEGGDWRMHSDATRNGLLVQIAPSSEFATYAAFKQAVLALPVEMRTTPVPSAKMTTLRGARLEFSFDDTPRVNGNELDLDGWPLFDSPFMRASRGSQQLELRYGKLRRKLDFRKPSVTDWIEK